MTKNNEINENYELTSSINSCIVVAVISAIMILISGAVSLDLIILLFKNEDSSMHVSQAVSCGFIFLDIIAFIVLFLITANLILKSERFLGKIQCFNKILSKGINKDDIQFLKETNLRDIVKEDLAHDKDLIKKFCDTLTEL